MAQRNTFGIASMLNGMRNESVTLAEAMALVEAMTTNVTNYIKSLPEEKGAASGNLVAKDSKQLVQFLFGVRSSTKSSIDFLKNHVTSNTDATENKKIQDLIDKFDDAMKVGIQYMDQMKKHNNDLAKDGKVNEQLFKLAQEDNPQALQKFMRDFDSQIGPDEADHALRYAAAAGRNRNISMVLGRPDRRCTDLLAAGKPSGKIALHHAVIKGHTDCVTALLHALDHDDYFHPVGQLEAKDAQGKTPVDYISSISSAQTKKEVIEAIKSALDSTKTHITEDARKNPRGDIKKMLDQLLVANANVSDNVSSATFKP